MTLTKVGPFHIEGKVATEIAPGATVDFSGKKDAGGHQNITVSNDGNNVKIDLASELHNVIGVVNGDSRVTLGTSFAGITNGQGASVVMLNGSTTINGKVTVDEQGKISGVAAGTADTDAVNVSQLKQVSDTANAGWTLSTNGNATAGTKVTPGAFVDFSGDDNVSVSNKGTAVSVKLNKNLQDIESISNGDAKLALNGAAGTAGIINGQGASVYMQGSTTVINKTVSVDKDGRISGVAAGKISADSTDAVNGSQLNAVATEAGKHSKVVNGNNTNVEETTVDGQKVYKVNLNNNIMVGDVTGKYVSISGTNGTIEATGAIATKDRVYADKGGKLADIDVTGNTISNGDAKLALDGAAGTAGIVNGKGASVYMQDGYTVINSKVSFDQDGKISGVAAGTADTDAVNVSQLKKVSDTANAGWNLSTNGVATEATNVKPGDNVDFSGDKNISVSNDDTKVKVELNKDLVDIESISNGDAKMALNGAAGTAGMINGKGASIYMQDGYTVINSKVAFDQNGKISGVAAGTADTDAVNVSQLKNSAWKLAANGVLTEAEDVKADDYVDFNGDQNVSVSKDAKDGVKTVKVELNKDLKDIESISNGDAKMALNGAAGTAGMINGKGASIYMQDGYTVINSKVAFDQNGKITGVAAGAITADSTDAVNGSQLHAVATEAGKHSKVVNGSNINVEEFDNDGQKIYKVNLNKDIMLGDLTGKNVSISGTNGTIETTGYIATKDRVYADKGAKLADIDVTGDTISNGDAKLALNGAAGTAGMINGKGASVYMQDGYTVINSKVAFDQNGKISGVAAGAVTADSTDAINGSQLHQTNENVAQNKADIAQNKADIAQNKADIAQNKADIAQNKADIATNKADIATNKANIAQNAADIKKVEALAKKHTTVAAGDNITVSDVGPNAEGGKEYKVALNKDITVDSVKAGDTTISDKGLEIKDGPSVTKDGINAANKNITNVADGKVEKDSKDAINGGQLHQAKADINNRIDGVENQVVSNTNRINQLGNRVNKVGAGAAALAALHPMDFDPDDKLTFSAGYGNYGGENAAAIGAYYRPDEKVMFSVGGTVGNGENMVNAGVSFSLDRTNHVSNSRTAMAREILDLRAEVTELKAMVAKGGLGSIAEDKMKIFPDVAENHWAYEYVGKLAAAGIIEGYPDGNFSGDRMMSRYEFAAMLYRAMQKGAQLDSKIINEFAPEMGRIRVDRISGEDGDRDKIERVRVNAVKGERDHYGNKIAKAEAKAK